MSMEIYTFGHRLALDPFISIEMYLALHSSKCFAQQFPRVPRYNSLSKKPSAITIKPALRVQLNANFAGLRLFRHFAADVFTLRVHEVQYDVLGQ